MKRVVCVRFPAWPLQRLRGDKPELNDRPLVLFAKGPRGGLRVGYCSSEAAKAGVRAEMPLAEARSLLTRMRPHFERHDADADRAALDEWAAWADRFSPFVTVDESEAADCLLMEAGGVTHLFGGEHALAVKIKEAFTQAGYFVRVAIADTIGAAWAAAHFGPVSGREPLILTSETLPQILHALPVESLRLPAAVLKTLYDLDLRRVGQVLRLPRESLPSRFGAVLLERLDQVLGKVSELCTFHRPAEPVAAEWDFEDPTTDRRVLESASRDLLNRLLAKLPLKKAGVLRLWCGLALQRPNQESVCFTEVDQVGGTSLSEAKGVAQTEIRAVSGTSLSEAKGVANTETTPIPLVWACHPNGLALRKPHQETACEPLGFSVELVSPCTCERHLGHLLDLRWERITLPGEVVRMRLEIAQTAPIRYRQRELFETETETDRQERQAFSALIDRLSSRLGTEAVLTPVLLPDYQPEHAVRFSPLVREQSQKKTKPKKQSGAKRLKPASSSSELTFPLARPVCLLRKPVAVQVMSVVPDGPPIRFAWKGRQHTVGRWWGPERIQTGWWRSRDVQRDYYRVETGEGCRFWLYRDLTAEGQWFLHGIF